MTVRLLGDSIIFNDGSRQWTSASSSFSPDQHWHDVTGSRGSGGWYYNDTGRFLAVHAIVGSGSDVWIEWRPNNQSYQVRIAFAQGRYGGVGSCSSVIPPWTWYQYNAGGQNGGAFWGIRELR